MPGVVLCQGVFTKALPSLIQEGHTYYGYSEHCDIVCILQVVDLNLDAIFLHVCAKPILTYTVPCSTGSFFHGTLQQAMQNSAVLPVKLVGQTIDFREKFAQRLCTLLGECADTHLTMPYYIVILEIRMRR